MLAGDIDATWAGYERFAGWPVPVWVVPGNHEYDGRDIDAAEAGLRELCARLGFSFLERGSTVFTGADAKNVGTNKPVDVTGIQLAGADAANYVLRETGIVLFLAAVVPLWTWKLLESHPVPQGFVPDDLRLEADASHLACQPVGRTGHVCRGADAGARTGCGAPAVQARWEEAWGSEVARAAARASGTPG